MSDFMRIGEALVNRGVITQVQLAELLAESEEGGKVPIGQRLIDRYGIAEVLVDEVNVQEVLMPRFRRLLLSSLLSISRSDKFSKGMDVKTFVVGIGTKPERVEVRVVSRRRYGVGQKGFVLESTDSGFVTNLSIRVTVKTAKGQNVQGHIEMRHDGLENKMTILDDEKHIRESVYYGLRAAFRSEG